MFEKGSRVTRKMSLLVGTVLVVSERGCIVKWDYPRLSGIRPYRVEEKNWIPLQFLQFASASAEENSRRSIRTRSLAPKPSTCNHCGSTNLEYIDRHHANHDGTPYVYVWRCAACQRFVTIVEQKEGISVAEE